MGGAIERQFNAVVVRFEQLGPLLPPQSRWTPRYRGPGIPPVKTMANFRRVRTQLERCDFRERIRLTPYAALLPLRQSWRSGSLLCSGHGLHSERLD